MKKLNILLYYLTWILNIFMLILVFAYISEGGLRTYFNSDTLYLASIYKDLFVDGTGFQGWHLNAAPNFFPDMFMYSIINYFIPNFRLAYLVFSIIQYLIILFLLNVLIKIIIPEIKIVFISLLNIIFPVFLLVSVVSGYFVYSFYLINHSYHTGVFINTLLVLIFFFNYLQKKKKRSFVFATLFTFIALYNDRLFLTLFTFPLVVLFVYNLIFLKNKLLNRISIVLIISSLLALIVFKFTSVNNFFSCIGLGEKYMNIDNIKVSFNNFIQQHLRYFKELRIQGFISLAVIVNFFIIPIIIIKRIIHKKSGNIDTIFFVLIFSSVFLTLLAPIINGYYFGIATTRFNIFSFWLSVFNLIIFAYYIFKKRTVIVFYVSSLLILLYAIYITDHLRNVNAVERMNYIANYYPEKVKVIDEFAIKHKLKYGLSRYWRAKYTTMFSKIGLRVYTVFSNFKPWFHVTNENWYFDYYKGKYNTPVFQFIILENFDKNRIKQDFGEPKDSLVFHGETILYVLNDIKFDRKNNIPYLLNDKN